MREPHVVRSARVQKMSLCAIGTPVSGPAAPCARYWSARDAAPMVSSSSTLMKLFSPPLKRAMRRRNSRASSTDETCFGASARESSVTVAFSTLLDHFGHEVQALFHRRRHRLVKRALVALANLVGPQALREVERMRHRLDARRVHGADLLDQREHAVQALEHRGLFVGPDGNACQTREASHVVGG